MTRRVATLCLALMFLACSNRATLAPDAQDGLSLDLRPHTGDGGLIDQPSGTDVTALDTPFQDLDGQSPPADGTVEDAAPPLDQVEPEDAVIPPLDLTVEELAPEEKPLLQINEIVTNAPNGGPDWFELLATGDEVVDLATFSVVDGDPDHPLLPLPDLTLEPGESVVIEAIAADDWSANPSIPYKLGSNDRLLLARDGQLVDQMAWWGQAPPEGASLGRLPDGDGDWQLLNPTPGAPNEELTIKLTTCYEPFFWDRATPVTIELAPADWAALTTTPEDEAWFQADFTFGGISLSGIGVRTKGGKSIAKISAGGSHRFSFKLDFNRYVDIMQFCGLKKVFLHNSYGDPSMLREHLAYRIARHLGVPAPRTALVDLTIGGEHLGRYLMVEAVDDDFFLDEHFKNDKGDLYEAKEPAGSLAWLGEDFASYEGFDLKTNQETATHLPLLFFLNVLHNGAPGDYATVMDINDTLQYLAWNTALSNLDSYNGEGRNYYLYEQEGIFTPIPWDTNEAFGSHGCGCTQEQILSLAIHEPTCNALVDRPLLEKLLAVEPFGNKYDGYLQEMLDGGLNPEVFAQWLAEPAQILRDGMEQGSYFYTTEQFEAALEDGLPGGGPDGDDVFGLTQFVAQRAAHIQAQLDGQEPAELNGLGNCTAD